MYINFYNMKDRIGVGSFRLGVGKLTEKGMAQ